MDEMRLSLYPITTEDAPSCTAKWEDFSFRSHSRYMRYCERKATWIDAWPNVFGEWMPHLRCDLHSHAIEVGLC